ncbi:MAG: BamA/TamA family outer membrane protein, partial [Bacteroidales bacterium]
SATSLVIDAQLFNIGVFNPQTGFKIVERKHTAKVIYTSKVHRPYTVTEINYSVSDDSISQLIISEKENALIVPGDDYNLGKLVAERSRIDELLKNNGYFFFNPDYLLFVADTLKLNRTVSFNLTLKDSIPPSALTAYRINNVYIDQDYTLNEEENDLINDTLQIQNTVFFGNTEKMQIRPKVVLQSIFVKKGETYSRKNHNITLNRLMSLGNFKFVQVKFTREDSLQNGLLDATILMTPKPKYNFRTEVDIVSKSNNYTGPKLDISFLDRNAFGGAELVKLNLEGTFEAQLGGKNKNLYSYSISPKVELYFPRFLLPFKIREKSMYTPKTHLSLAFKYLKMVNYYDMRTLEFIYGYKWKTDIKREHDLNPVSISYSSFSNQSAEFIALIESNPYLKRSYEEQFITGGSYAFTYNEQVLSGKKMQYYLHLTTEIAGNTLFMAKRLGGEKISSDNPSKIAGSVFSQFARFSIDGRGYYNLKNQNRLVSRIFMGLAIPYGNSDVLPYSKQFFSGGPNSLRAFHINSVGPGNYDQASDSNNFLQLGGDIKLEINLEYRFNIISYFKGALFVDAGNVWELKSNPAKVGTPFNFSGLLSETALGAGAGIRIDLSFFVLRFDLAMPLRKPWIDKHNRWVINEINFGDSSWRRDNLILNIAIGYPF